MQPTTQEDWTPIAVGSHILNDGYDRALREAKAPGGPQLWLSRYCGYERTVLVGFHGAQTQICSGRHIPRFSELAPAFVDLGVKQIGAISYNDYEVLARWAEDTPLGAVDLLSDGNLAFAERAGLLDDLTAEGMGFRVARFAMLVERGRVRILLKEPSPLDFGQTTADELLKRIPTLPELPPLTDAEREERADIIGEEEAEE